MKKIFILLGIFALALTSCVYEEPRPFASFSADTEFAEPGEIIGFRNKSNNYSRIEWDFGDGSVSDVSNPTHWYSNPGVYTVTLTVYNYDKVDRAYLEMVVDFADPVSNFSSEYLYYEPGDLVEFTNKSANALRYLWDFGDGTVSELKDPVHKYVKEGVYKVTLKAYNGDKVDVSTLLIEVNITTLEVEVREYGTESLISGIDVVLYKTKNDWTYFKNDVGKGTTGLDGVAVFRYAEDISYFIDVFGGIYDNEALAANDMAFARTEPLSYGRINVFIAYVTKNQMRPKVAASKDGKRVRQAKVENPKYTVKGSGLVLQRIKKKK